MKGAKILKIAGWVLLGLCAAALLGLVLGLVVMWLWNWLMPAIFGLPEIGYWQAVGLFILAHLLFKGHREHHPGDEHDGHATRFRARVKSFMRKHAPEDGPGESDGPEPHAAS
ncbi:MAG: hypothetical protein JXR96_25995 [Deltaproteobacteria bacterium]|nr:hypothetical protein [Deltaproteobacteria bacterium]